MKFIEALKLKSKLFFLFILTTIALISMGIIGTMHINSMKKTTDDLYFGSLVPITELDEIIQVYHNGLADTLYKASRLEISPEQSSEQIKKSLAKITDKWTSYQSHFKRNDELEYVEYVDMEIKRTNSYFLKVYAAIKDGKDISNISLSTLEKKVSYIHNVVQKLINYEINVASYERKKFLQVYSQAKTQLGFTFFIIISSLIVISLYVFKSIQGDHTKLEVATKKLRRANKKLENVSYTDSLTNLHNRRYFNLVYDRELKRAKRQNSYITFMMLDIDFFKQFNDTYGHIEGDYALKTVANTLKTTLKRPSDYVFRLGGEEFGVLLIDTDESSSAKLARDICNAVLARELKHENSKAHEFVTISIGVVCCIADDALEDEVLMSRADEMLYQAKETGRNRYMITTNVTSAKTKEVNEDLSA